MKTETTHLVNNISSNVNDGLDVYIKSNNPLNPVIEKKLQLNCIERQNNACCYCQCQEEHCCRWEP